MKSLAIERSTTLRPYITTLTIVITTIVLSSFLSSTSPTSLPSFSRRLLETKTHAHENLFPLTISDYMGLACSILGLLLASGGGIGGGGILGEAAGADQGRLERSDSSVPSTSTANNLPLATSLLAPSTRRFAPRPQSQSTHLLWALHPSMLYLSLTSRCSGAASRTAG